VAGHPAAGRPLAGRREGAPDGRPRPPGRGAGPPGPAAPGQAAPDAVGRRRAPRRGASGARAGSATESGSGAPGRPDADHCEGRRARCPASIQLRGPVGIPTSVLEAGPGSGAPPSARPHGPCLPPHSAPRHGAHATGRRHGAPVAPCLAGPGEGPRRNPAGSMGCFRGGPTAPSTPGPRPLGRRGSLVHIPRTPAAAGSGFHLGRLGLGILGRPHGPLDRPVEVDPRTDRRHDQLDHTRTAAWSPARAAVEAPGPLRRPENVNGAPAGAGQLGRRRAVGRRRRAPVRRAFNATPRSMGQHRGAGRCPSARLRRSDARKLPSGGAGPGPCTGRSRKPAVGRKDPAIGTAGRSAGARGRAFNARRAGGRPSRGDPGRVQATRGADTGRRHGASTRGADTGPVGHKPPGRQSRLEGTGKSGACYPLAAASFVALAQSALNSSMPRSVSG